MSEAVVMWLFWPGVVVLCGLINMLTSWTFSWSELIFDYAIGVIAGWALFAGVTTSNAVADFFFIFSHGPFAILWELSDDFKRTFSNADAVFLTLAVIRIGSTAAAGLLDRVAVAIGHTSGWAILLSIVLAPIKMANATITGAVGLLIWFAGLINAASGGKVYWAGGMLMTEFKPGGGRYWATTVGWTIHTWVGNCPFAHELYHSRQYIYMGDWLIPFWLVGCLWGGVTALIEAASPSTRFDKHLMIGARHGNMHVGNPIEVAAHQI